jgi:hypothetical protein
MDQQLTMDMEVMATNMGRNMVTSMVKSTRNPRTSRKLRTTRRAARKVTIRTAVMRARGPIPQILQTMKMAKMRKRTSPRTTRLLTLHQPPRAIKR